MSKTHCPGCGAPFQSDKPGEPGFLPPEARERETPICRRCYKLKHYGQLESFGRSNQRIRDTVHKTGHELDLAVLVVDLFDLEGSLHQEWRKLINSPVLLALNKVDLLPKRTPVDEVIEAATKISRARIPDLQWKEVIAVSAETGTGLLQLKERMIYRRGRNHRIGFFGVTNTGKSSLLSRFLPLDQSRPTISNRPGTTQGATSWYVTDDDLTLIDTPGWVPGTRLTDLLCPDCSGKLIVKSKIISKYLD
ncbi:MAG TPA: GTPase, partial [Bacillota bacterium]|nr:GTPase [Bacillota bacterium]